MLEINENKTKVITFGRGGHEDLNKTELEICYEEVDSFKYLGDIVNSQNDEHVKIKYPRCSRPAYSANFKIANK